MVWTPANVNSRDAQLAEILHLADTRIATAYRIPPPLLSLDGAAGPQGSTEAVMQLWFATGAGFCANLIEDGFGRLFGLKGYPDEYVELDFSALLRASQKDRIEALARGVQGGIYAPNEARALEDLPGMPFGDEPRVQSQVVPLSAWAEPPPPMPASDAAPAAPAAESDQPPPANENVGPKALAAFRREMRHAGTA
jgi:phage portal protein BeeE